jgi:hypothetical protein
MGIGQRWTDEEIEILRNNYNGGIITEGIQTLLPNRSRKAISSEIQLLGIGKQRANTTWTAEEDATLRHNFLEGVSIRRICNLQAKSFTNVRKRILVLGLKRPWITWEVKKGIPDFSRIESEEKAYFLGFVGADGCMRKSLCGIRIELSIKDKDILEKIVASLFPTTHINYRRGSTTAQLDINSKRLCLQLLKHGIHPNKTWSLKRPSTVPPTLLNHYLRGYLDGDGGFYLNDGGPRLIVSSASDDIMCLFAETANKIGVDMSNRKPFFYNNGIGKFSLRGTKAQTMANYLYKDATIYLDRKFIVFNQIKNYNKKFTSI